MKDFRNLKRALCFNRALRKHNKRNIPKLNPSSVFILLAVYDILKDPPCTTSTILEFLERNKHTYSSTVVNSAIKLFKENGWVEVSNTYPARYTLTVEGMNTLNELERRVRVERSDK
jgi:hypothetical protein